MSKNKIEKIVASYVAKKRSYFATKVLIGLAVAAVCAFTAIILLDSQLYLPSGVRLSVTVLAGVAALGALIWAVILPCVAFRQKQAIQEIESHNENKIGQMLRTSIEASQRKHESPITAAMSEMLIEQAAEKLENVDTSRYIPWKIVAKRVAILLVITAAVFGIDQLWGGFQTGVKRFVAPTKDITYTNVTANSDTTVFREGSFYKKLMKQKEAKDATAKKIAAKNAKLQKEKEAKGNNSSIPTEVKISAEVTGLNTGNATVYVRDVSEDKWEHYEMENKGEGKYSYVLTGDKILNTFDYYVESGDDVSETKRVRKQEKPKIVSIKTVLDYPEYTLRKQQIGNTASIDALEGTKVTVSFVVNHELKNIKLLKDVERDGKVVTIVIPHTSTVNKKNGEETITASFVMEKGRCKYRLTGFDQDNLYLPERDFTLLGREDHKPNIDLITPKDEVSISRLGEIPFKIYADDDIRISEIGIIMIVDEDEEKVVKRFEFKDKIVREKTTKFDLLVEDLDLDINSSVILHAYVKDGKNRKILVSSNPVFLNIRPFKEHKRKKKAKKGQQKKKKQKKQLIKLEAAIKGQRKIITDTFKILKGQIVDPLRFEKIVKKQTKLTKDVTDLSNAMQKSNKVEQFVKDAVLAASKQMQKTNKKLGVSESGIKGVANKTRKEFPVEEMSKAFRSETLALAKLIKARENILKVIKEQQKKEQKKKKSKSKSKSKNKNNKKSAAGKFAAELEKAAKFEKKTYETLANKDILEKAEMIRTSYDNHNSAEEIIAEVINKMEQNPAPKFDPVVKSLLELSQGDVKTAYDILSDANLNENAKADFSKAERHVRLSEQEIKSIIKFLHGLDPKNLTDTMKNISKDLGQASRDLREAARLTRPDSTGKLSQANREKAQALTDRAKRLTSRANAWIDSLKNAKLNGLEGLKERLAQAQKAGLEVLPNKIDTVNNRRKTDEFQESNKKAEEAAKELQKFAEKFEGEFQDLTRTLLKKLADAKQAAQGVKKAGQKTNAKGNKGSKKGQKGGQKKGQQGGGKSKPNAKSELKNKRALAAALLSKLKDLKGAEYKKLAGQLEKILKTPDKDIPQELLDKIIAQLEKHMDLIEATNILGDEAAVVPDNYKASVQQYKVDLSTDLITEEDLNGSRRR